MHSAGVVRGRWSAQERSSVPSSTTGKDSQIPVTPQKRAIRQAETVMPTQPRKREIQNAALPRSVALRKAADI